MKIENKVCTIEQAKRLKELGVDQRSEWFWVYPAKKGMISTTYGVYHKSVAHDFIDNNEGNEFDSELSAALDVAELGMLLPDKYATVKFNGIWAAWEVLGTFIFKDIIGITEAECRASILIELIENGELKQLLTL